MRTNTKGVHDCTTIEDPYEDYERELSKVGCSKEGKTLEKYGRLVCTITIAIDVATKVSHQSMKRI